MKNLIAVIDTLNSGGAQRQFQQLVNYVYRRKFRVSIIVLHESSFYLSGFAKDVDVHFLKSKSISGKLFKFFLLCRNIKPKVVVSFLDGPNYLNIITSSLLGFDTVVCERNYSSKVPLLKRALFRFANIIVSNSNAQSAVLRGAGLLQCVTITNYVDFSLFNFKRRFGNSHPEYFRFLIVGRFALQKNPKFLLSEAAAASNNFYFDWCGDVSIIEKIDGSIVNTYEHFYGAYKEMFDAGKVTILKPTNNIIEVYERYNFMILPSLYEGTPNVLLEGMACGLIVFVSNIIAHKDIIEDGVNGFVFEIECSGSLVRKIEYALSLPIEKLEIISNQARKLVEKRYSLNEKLMQWNKVLDGDSN